MAKNGQGETDTIRGLLERVTFRSETNGYSVWRVRVPGYQDLVTAVGYTLAHSPGEQVELKGSWEHHPKYGDQFAFKECQTVLPSSIEGIRRYLCSGLIKGVGEKTAERIVNAFGARTFDVLDHSPDDLNAVEGITKKQIDSIKASWTVHCEVRDVMVFLQGGGISPAFATKIYEFYKGNTIDVVRADPYRLAKDIFGIGFISADNFARGIGVDLDSPLRIAAGVLHALSEGTGRGDVFLPRKKLVQDAATLLDVSEDAVDEAIRQAKQAHELVIKDVDYDYDGSSSLEAVYLPPYFTAEQGSALQLTRIILAPSNFQSLTGGLDVNMALSCAHNYLNLTLEANQLLALKTAFSSKVSVITGGPGTGKTTIVKAIVGVCEANKLRVILCAPTGRAAKRLSLATEHEAKTIHRTLEYSNNDFTRNDENPLECDVLIVDEASMIDQQLMYSLLKAVPDRAMLVLVGDINQLPSVGAGNVLKDIIASNEIPVASLTEIFRQAQDSQIIVNAHKVNRGELPLDAVNGSDRLSDYYFIERENPEECLETILQMACERIPARFGLDPSRDIQVLTPMRRSILGTDNLNAELRKRLNSDEDGTEPSVTFGVRDFRRGDKVMQIRNDYEKGVFNGDIGRVADVDAREKILIVDFDGQGVRYSAPELTDLVHAFAISIHKSQGSEYPAVVIPVSTMHYVMLQRNLIYTGMTRGKELVVLVGTKKALSIAVHKNDTSRRFTLLDQRIKSTLAENLGIMS